MKITIYGPGCARCRQTETLVREVIAQLGRDIEVEKISDLQGMMTAGIMSTPAVAVDGVVKSTGLVPGKDSIRGWIEDPPKAATGGCCCGGTC